MYFSTETRSWTEVLGNAGLELDSFELKEGLSTEFEDANDFEPVVEAGVGVVGVGGNGDVFLDWPGGGGGNGFTSPVLVVGGGGRCLCIVVLAPIAGVISTLLGSVALVATNLLFAVVVVELAIILLLCSFVVGLVVVVVGVFTKEELGLDPPILEGDTVILGFVVEVVVVVGVISLVKDSLLGSLFTLVTAVCTPLVGLLLSLLDVVVFGALGDLGTEGLESGEETLNTLGFISSEEEFGDLSFSLIDKNEVKKDFPEDKTVNPLFLIPSFFLLGSSSSLSILVHLSLLLLFNSPKHLSHIILSFFSYPPDIISSLHCEHRSAPFSWSYVSLKNK